MTEVEALQRKIVELETELTALKQQAEVPIHRAAQQVQDADSWPANEEQFRVLVEACPIGIYVADDTFQFAYANQQMANMLGCSRSELQSMDLRQFVTADQLSNLIHVYQQHTSAADVPTHHQISVSRKDGQPRQFDAYIETISYPDDKPRWVWYFMDETEQSNIEKALRQSESRFSHIFNASPSGISLSRASDGKFLDVNNTFLSIFGYGREEVIGKTAYELNVWNDFDDRDTLLDRLRLEGIVHLQEIQVRIKSGEIRTVLASTELIEVDGETCLLAIFDDDTEHLRLEERFTKIFKDSPIGITITSLKDGRYIDVNDAWLSLFDFRREDVIGQTSKSINLLFDYKERAPVVAEVIQRGYAAPHYFVARHKDGHPITSLATLEVMELGGEQCILAFTLDMTEHRYLEERFTKVFQASPIAITITALDDNRILEANDAFFTLSGYSYDEVIGSTSQSLGLMVEDPQQSSLVEQLREDGSIKSYDLKLRHKSGRTLIALCSAELLGLNGQPCVLCFYVDITERRQTEERFACIFQAGLVSIAISTVKEGRYIDVNRAWMSLFGYSREEAIGETTQSLNILVNPADRAYSVEVLRNQMGPNYRQLRRRSGEIITALTTAELIELNGEPCILGLALDMTEHQRIEQEARQLELRFSTIFHKSPVGICISTFDEGLIIDANEAFLSLLGYSREEAVGQTTETINMWVDYSQRSSLAEQMAKAGRAAPLDLKIRHKSGQILTTWVSAEFIEVQGHHCILAFYVDITERNRAEEKIRQSEIRFSTIFHSSPIPTSIIAVESLRIIDVNQALMSLMGYSREELIGNTGEALNWYVDVDLGDRDTAVNQMAEHGGVFGPLDLHWRTKSGQIINTITSARLIELDGELCLLNFLIDVTERQRAEEALRETEKRFSTIFHDSPLAISISQISDGHLVDVNDAFLSLFGYTREQLLDRTIYVAKMWVDPDQRTAYEQLRQQQGGVRQFEFTFRRETGETGIALLSSEEIELDGKSCSVAFTLDITDRKQMEKALQVAYQGLEQRVQERTTDLANAVAALREEVEERKRAQAAEHDQRLLAEVLHNTAALLNSTLNLDIVLDRILSNIQQVIPHDAACLLLIESGMARIVGFRGNASLIFGQSELPQNLSLTELPPVLSQMINSAHPQIISDLQGQFSRNGSTYVGNLASAVSTPIRVETQLVGFLILFSRVSAFFTSNHRGRLLAFAEQAATAIQNARLNEQARQAAVVEERNRISHDLHDAVSQTLWSASLIADVLPIIWSRDPDAGRQNLVELRQLTRGALAEMRTLLLELRPAALAEGELAELLQHLSSAFSGRTGIDVSLTVIGRSPLPPEVQIALYRIAQESLSNVKRHANASNVRMTLRYEAEYVLLSVSDNGDGFDSNAIPTGHMGLGIMRERAWLIGANLKINSELGQGTELVLTYPRRKGSVIQ